jgi:hypothetical protein
MVQDFCDEPYEKSWNYIPLPPFILLISSNRAISSTVLDNYDKISAVRVEDSIFAISSIPLYHNEIEVEDIVSAYPSPCIME